MTKDEIRPNFIGGPACGREDIVLSRNMPLPCLYEISGSAYALSRVDPPTYIYRRNEPRETLGV